MTNTKDVSKRRMKAAQKKHGRRKPQPHEESRMFWCAPVYIGDVLPPKLAEFLSIAFDASITDMYAPGTRRHIKAALGHGATMEEIMEVLKICVAEGVQACNLSVPILAEEIAHRSAKGRQSRR